MRKFSKSAREISVSTNLSVLDVLKCFDAIPLIRNKRIAAAKEVNNQAAESSSSQQDESVKDYIGRYIVKKVLQKRGLGPGEKHFLNKCVVNMDSLFVISEYFLQILMRLEETFRLSRTQKHIDIYSAVECVSSSIIQDQMKQIAGEECNDHACTSCMFRVAMLYYKITGHRLATKTLNDKTTEKCSKSLRKQYCK